MTALSWPRRTRGSPRLSRPTHAPSCPWTRSRSARHPGRTQRPERRSRGPEGPEGLPLAASHVRTDPSADPLTILEPSYEYATALTQSVWPCSSRATGSSLAGSHTRTAWSADPLTIRRPSGENAAAKPAPCDHAESRTLLRFPRPIPAPCCAFHQAASRQPKKPTRSRSARRPLRTRRSARHPLGRGRGRNPSNFPPPTHEGYRQPTHSGSENHPARTRLP